MKRSMERSISSDPVSAGGSTMLPPAPLPKLPRGEKHLDAMLLAIVQQRKVEDGVLPGVPFH
jgi:hypothetical protein